MRYKPEHKQHTRGKILAAAARRFKKDGFEGTSVAAVMGDAELTHGGFYAHFDSKDDLVASVIRTGFDDASVTFEALFDHLEGDAWLTAWVTEYLSHTHAHLVAEGCPLPALAGEIARAGSHARGAFTTTFYERLAVVSGRVNAPTDEAERRVLAAISQMSGAIMLARATDEPLRTRILDAARAEAIGTLTANFAPQSETVPPPESNATSDTARDTAGEPTE